MKLLALSIDGFRGIQHASIRLLRLQLALLKSEPDFARLRDQVIEIAGQLEEKSAIPMVRDQMALILEVQTDEWWEDVTVPMLEIVRRRLRSLVAFIEKRKRTHLYTDFEDQIGIYGPDAPGAGRALHRDGAGRLAGGPRSGAGDRDRCLTLAGGLEPVELPEHSKGGNLMAYCNKLVTTF